MKKLLLLPFLLLLITTSCSTDSDEIITTDNTAFSTERSAQATDCFSSLSAHVYNVGTLSDPNISYIADMPANIPAAQTYKVVLQIQATDCEDITNGFGDIINFTSGSIFFNVSNSSPHIEVKPAQTLPCYRWRLVVQCVNARSVATCTSTTQWYDAPVL